MTDDQPAHRQTVILKLAHCGSEEIQLFLFRHAARIKQTDFTILQSAFLPKLDVAALGSEQPRVQAARQNMDAIGLDPPRLERLAVVAGVDINDVHLLVKPLHEIPRQGLHPRVIGQDAHVLREVGVVNTARLDPENLRREQGAQSDRTRRADDHLGETLALHVIDDFQDGRKAQLLQFIFGKFEFADRLEIFDRDIAWRHFAARCRHGEIESFGPRRGSHFTDRGRDTVDVLQRVGEPDTLVVAQVFRDFAASALTERPQFRAARRAERVEIRGKPEGQRDERADKLQTLDKSSGLQLRDELRKEAEGQLVDQKIGREKGTAFGLGHALGRFFDGRAHTRFPHGIGQLLPKRRIAGEGDFPNFSGGDALREEAEFFRQGEPRRVFALHETSGHFFEQGGGRFLRSLGQTLAGEIENDTVKTVGHDQRPAPLAARTALSFAQRGQKFVRRPALGFSPSPSQIDPALVVRTPGEGLFPRLVPQRLEFSLRRESFDVRWRQPRQRELRRLSEQRIAQSVDRFEMAEKQNQPLPMVDRKPFVHRPERMGHRVRDLLRLEVAGQVIDIAAQPLDFRMLRFGDAPGEQVHLDIVLGKKCGDFLAEKNPRLARDLQAAVDRVMVGEGDEVEPIPPQRTVDLLRLGATRRKIHLAQQPVRGPRAVTRVEMEIGAAHETHSLDATAAYFTSGIAGNFRTRQTQRTTITSAKIPAKSPNRSGNPGKGTKVP